MQIALLVRPELEIRLHESSTWWRLLEPQFSSPAVKIGVLILDKIAQTSASHRWLHSMSPWEQEEPRMSGPIPKDADFIILGVQPGHQGFF